MKYLAITIMLCLLSSCIPEGLDEIDDESEPFSEPKEDPIAAKFGEWVDFPKEFRDQNSVVTDVKMTDKGIYMVGTRLDDETTHILRYNLDQRKITEGKWEDYTYDRTSEKYIFITYYPINPNSELLKPHDVFVQNAYLKFDTPAYLTVNISSGKQLAKEIPPKHTFGNYESYGFIKKDGKGNDWCIFLGNTEKDGDVIVIKLKKGTGQPNHVFSFRNNVDFEFHGAPKSALLLAYSFDKNFHIFSPDGKARYYDLSNILKNSTYKGIKKIQETNQGLFFQLEDKIFRFFNNRLSLFHTIDSKTYLLGVLPNFAVDDKYMFTSEGLRIKLTGFYEETSMFPAEPFSTKADKIEGFYERYTTYKNGTIETSTDPEDKYYYIVDIVKRKILILSKEFQSP